MKKLKFVGSFDKMSKLPHSLAEICFVGRSNVGKSSTINAIFGQQIAKTSKTPGRTLGLNFFRFGDMPCFVVDLPGYGFAKVSQNMLAKWHVLLPEYIKKRDSLKKVYMVIDSKVGFTRLDIDVVNILKEAELPMVFIFNKIDKASKEKVDVLAKLATDMYDQDFCFISAKRPSPDSMFKLKTNIQEAIAIPQGQR
jgi:GTP-binding protein